MRDPSTNPPKAMFQLSGFYCPVIALIIAFIDPFKGTFIDPFKGTFIDPFKGTFIDPFKGTLLICCRKSGRARSSGTPQAAFRSPRNRQRG